MRKIVWTIFWFFLAGLISVTVFASKAQASVRLCPLDFKQAAYGQVMSLGNGLTLKIWPKSQSVSGLGIWRLIWVAYNQSSPLAATLQIEKTGCLSSTVGNTCGPDKAVAGSSEKISVDHLFPHGYSEFAGQGSVWAGDYPYCFLWQADLRQLIIHSVAGDRTVDWRTSWFTLRN